MEIKEIRAFLVLAEELNFRRAAERLNITQPPLTRMISNLEYNLGVKLFNRTTRTVELTGAGIHLLGEGQKLIDQTEELEGELRKLAKQKLGKLVIGLNRVAIHSALPKVLSEFKVKFPKAKIDINELNDGKVLSQLRSGKMDIIFTATKFSDDSIGQFVVETEQLGFIINKEHKLAKKKELTLKDLKDQILVFHGKKEPLGFQNDFLQILKQNKINVEIYTKKLSESCDNLVMLNKGLVLSIKKMAKVSSELTFVPLKDFSPKLKIYATYRKDHDGHELKALLNFFSKMQGESPKGLSHF